jgi:hypothetical protein
MAILTKPMNVFARELARDRPRSPLGIRPGHTALGHLTRDLEACLDRPLGLETVYRPPDPRGLSLGLAGQIQSVGELEEVLEFMGDVLERLGIEGNHDTSDSDTIAGDAEPGPGSKLRCFGPRLEDGYRSLLR